MLPIVAWLKAQGVQFVQGAQVTDLDFAYGPAGRTVDRIRYYLNDTPHELPIGADDLVFVTNGSMTAASSFGSMTTPATLQTKDWGGSWMLWETLARKHADFGNPSAFNGNVAASKWMSFTATMHDPLFFALMERFTGKWRERVVW